MKVYLTGDDRAAVNDLAIWLDEQGVTVVSNWHIGSARTPWPQLLDRERGHYALAQAGNVRLAGMTVVLRTGSGSDPDDAAGLVGLALGLRRHVILFGGGPVSLLEYHPRVRRVSEREELLRAVRDPLFLSRRRAGDERSGSG